MYFNGVAVLIVATQYERTLQVLCTFMLNEINVEYHTVLPVDMYIEEVLEFLFVCL